MKRIGFEFELSAERRRSIGNDTSWHEYAAELRKFKQDKGHWDVPETTRLGVWWKHQKEKLEILRMGGPVDLTTAQVATLTELSARSERDMSLRMEKSWEAWFGDLLAYRIHAKTFRVPNSS